MMEVIVILMMGTGNLRIRSGTIEVTNLGW